MPWTWSACSWVQITASIRLDLGVEKLGAQVGRGVDQDGLAPVLDQDRAAPPAVARVGAGWPPPTRPAVLAAGPRHAARRAAAQDRHPHVRALRLGEQPEEVVGGRGLELGQADRP